MIFHSYNSRAIFLNLLFPIFIRRRFPFFFAFRSHHSRAFAILFCFYFGSFKNKNLILHSHLSRAFSFFYSFLSLNPRAIIWFSFAHHSLVIHLHSFPFSFSFIRIIQERSSDYSLASFSFIIIFHFLLFSFSHHLRAISWFFIRIIKEQTFD